MAHHNSNTFCRKKQEMKIDALHTRVPIAKLENAVVYFSAVKILARLHPHLFFRG